MNDLTGKDTIITGFVIFFFDLFFIYYLIKEMRATIPKSDFLGGGKAHEMYTSMLDTHLSRELADKGGIGMSSLLMDRLSAKAVVKTTETGHNE